MAHIPPTAAIFSPSVARLASSAAKDWSYVDSWLSSKFPGRSPPPFERNAETLKVLVALAALNESVDEDHDLVSKANSSALETLSKGADLQHTSARDPTAPPSASPETIAEGVIAAIEDDLSREGRSAIDALASTSAELGIAYPDPAVIGSRITNLQTRLFQLEQAQARMQVLQAYVQEQSSESRLLLKDLESDAYRPAASLAKLNLELQRKVRAGTARLQDTRERTMAQNAAPKYTVQQIQEEEALYLELLGYKKVLDRQIMSFQGLPPDKNLARQQLEALRSELVAATQKRDVVFEGLVEKATPKKKR
ncbi:hypothetical protein F503_01937 [Ophiostoma piceae UAMH 11346]|uniref:HAUS augmin-like complex subunit 1 n=1 Tax=Ophiostoma piceae (strain UAMH 11346) TaxID=1262450 RepID=S3BQS0_OPHP1|nr:hypothetical protein F503_01937 [Ophiostoma piceae UAMH 11346]